MNSYEFIHMNERILCQLSHDYMEILRVHLSLFPKQFQDTKFMTFQGQRFYLQIGSLPQNCLECSASVGTCTIHSLNFQENSIVLGKSACPN